jgi:transposase-like protein
VLGSVGGDRTMNETTPSTTTANSSTKRVRRQYDAAFKQSAVAHCQRHGGDVTRTAQELGLNHWTLRDWMQAERDKNQPPPVALTLAETQAENARLRAELARVTEQRDILKKSLGILSLP